MTFYKSLATKLQDFQGDLNMRYFPMRAPQGDHTSYGTTETFCIFNMITNDVDTVHEGGFQNGVAIVQFDFFSKSLEKLDESVEAFINVFVGRSLVLNSDYTAHHSDLQSEFDEFEHKQGLYVKSIDLRISYIKTS